MKRILNILSCLTFSALTTININACDFFDNNSHKSKPLYENEEWFNGTSSQYEGNIVDNINIMSWKKYHLNWQSFIKKYQLLNFDDKAIIKVETATYKNCIWHNLPSQITGPNLSVNTAKINTSNNTNDEKNKTWNIEFMYYYGSWLTPLVFIHIYAQAFFWYSNNGNIYLSIHLKEESKNAVEGAHFKLQINSAYLS
ncbi:hypothetical protein [Spiroplasma endosymbiont of Dasysyrphus albostriatus]|uniref:hypothetical protein n=1 Tax=Spiroplasma endosymbiont of Dasysyrphus albostriatus TaxID=3066299 RepID=UPI0030CC450E